MTWWDNGGVGKPNSWHPGDDDVGHVPIFCNYLQTLDRFIIAHNIIEESWTVLFNPFRPRKSVSGLADTVMEGRMTNHGSS